MKKIFTVLTALTLVLMGNNNSVSALDNETVTVRHIVSNSAIISDVSNSLSMVMFEHTDENHPIDLNPKPLSRLDVRDLDAWLGVPAPLFGNIYDFTTIVYTDGTEVYLVDYDFDIRAHENATGKKVSEVSFDYSNSGYIVVNKYLDEVLPDNLVNINETYGPTDIDYTIDGGVVRFPAALLSIDPTYENYELISSTHPVDVPIAFNGQEAIIVNLVYKKPEPRSTLTINYVDSDGNKLHESKFLEGVVGSSWTEEAIDLPGYVVVDNASSMTGIFESKNSEHTFVYDKLKESTVSILYKDTDGKEIHESTTLTGLIGEGWTAKALEINGYELVSLASEMGGEFIEDNFVVTFVYKAVAKPEITIPDKGVLSVNREEIKQPVTDGTNVLPKTGSVNAMVYMASASVFLGVLLKFKNKNR